STSYTGIRQEREEQQFSLPALKTPLFSPQRRHTRFAMRNWVWIPITFAAIMLIPALSRRSAKTDIFAVDSTGMPALPPSASLDLKAQRDGKVVRFTWDRTAPPILEAERGVLWIKEAGNEQRLDLDGRQLAVGSVIYWPLTGGVNFGLEV